MFEKRDRFSVGSGGNLIDQQPHSTALQNVSIIVVDDDDDARELMATVLANAGARVTTADSVRTALEALSKEQAAVIVSDIGMPLEDGYDLIRRVREGSVSKALSGIPAVAVTAFASAKDRQKALNAGFQEHVAKPFDAQRLVQLVSRLACQRA
ncbi:MAG: response regulator [Polyangiaceae bacterium]